MVNYSQEQFWKIYKTLPEELQEALFSTEAADFVYNICEENNIEKSAKIIKYISDVLIGLLPVEEFQKTLEKELGIEKETAKKVAREINRFIFLPVRPFLERLCETKSFSEKESSVVLEEVDKKNSKEDVYREPIQ